MRLNQITVLSKDLNVSIQFYQKLGLKLIVDSIPHYARLVCPDGDSTFSLHHSEQFQNTAPVWIYFECDNLDEEYKRLKKEGLDFEHEPIDQNWLWREARLKDPDGHQIILYKAGENRINPPWKIKNS